MSLLEIKQKWEELKTIEDNAKKQRHELEEEIFDSMENVPEKGTVEICNGFAFSVGTTTTFDQEALMDLYRSGEIKNFPFEKQFKPINAELKYLEKNDPASFNKIMECAVMKPRKPSFKVKG